MISVLCSFGCGCSVVDSHNFRARVCVSGLLLLEAPDETLLIGPLPLSSRLLCRQFDFLKGIVSEEAVPETPFFKFERLQLSAIHVNRFLELKSQKQVKT